MALDTLLSEMVGKFQHKLANTFVSAGLLPAPSLPSPLECPRVSKRQRALMVQARALPTAVRTTPHRATHRTCTRPGDRSQLARTRLLCPARRLRDWAA